MLPEAGITHFHAPTRMVSGLGSLSRLGEEAGRYSRKCLVVTGRRSSKLSGVLERLERLLASARIEVTRFDQVEPNPTVETVQDGAALARASRVRWVLAVGGGSTIDAAKAIALMAVNQGDLRPFFQGMRPEHRPFPIVAVPTTAGSGSEVTPYAVITDVPAGDKFAIALPEMFPAVAILDPEITVSMPEGVTVDSGLDALCHAIEALFASRRSAHTDILARHSIGHIVRDLPLVRGQSENLAARSRMQFAATLAGMAIANTATLAPHALGFPVTVRYGLPHGRATALIMPAFLEQMIELEAERAREVGEMLGKREDPPAALRSFIEALGVAPRLGAYGMRAEDVETFSLQAKDRKHLQNGPSEWTGQMVQDLYRKSL